MAIDPTAWGTVSAVPIFLKSVMLIESGGRPDARAIGRFHRPFPAARPGQWRRDGRRAVRPGSECRPGRRGLAEAWQAGERADSEANRRSAPPTITRSIRAADGPTRAMPSSPRTSSCALNRAFPPFPEPTLQMRCRPGRRWSWVLSSLFATLSYESETRWRSSPW